MSSDLTMGHHMIMGRRTFESIGRLLPGRTTIIVTRNPEYKIPDALIAHSLESAIEMAAGDEQVFVVGGGEIYRQALRLATRIYLTRVHINLKGDTTFPEVDWDRWQQVESVRHQADEKNQFDYSFQDYHRQP